MSVITASPTLRRAAPWPTGSTPTRLFAVDAHTTRVSEHIDYTYAPGLKGLFSRLLFAKAGLTFLFAWRAWATRRAVEGKQQ